MTWEKIIGKKQNNFLALIIVGVMLSTCTGNSGNVPEETWSNDGSSRTLFQGLFKKPLDNDEFSKRVLIAFDSLRIKGEYSHLHQLVGYAEQHNIQLDDKHTSNVLKYLEAFSNILTHDHKGAVKRYQEIYDSSLDGGDERLLVWVLNDLGVLSYFDGNDNGARYYYNEALKYVDENKDPSIAIDLYYNLSRQAIRHKDWQNGIDMAQKSILLIKKNNIKKYSLKYLYSQMGTSLIGLKQYPEASEYIDLAYGISSAEKSIKAMKNSLDARAELMVALGQNEAAIENYRSALDYYDEVNEFQQRKYNEAIWNRQKLQNDMNKDYYQKLFLFKWLLYITLILLLTIGFLGTHLMRMVGRQKRSFKTIRRLNEDLRHSLTESELANAKLASKNWESAELLMLNEKSLFSKELKLSTFNDALRNIAKYVSELAESEQPIPTNKILPIERNLLSMIDDGAVWEDFKLQFEKIRPRFFEELKSRFPELSVNDLKHCSYVVSRLRTKDVANLLGISPRSVETVRYRLRKKMDVEKDTQLYDFLQSI